MIFRYERPASLSLDFKPKLSVTVIVPARNNQAKLDLVLAALAVQSYPSRLTKVIVIDDGSDKKLVLPKIRPSQCSLLRIENRPGMWGKVDSVNAIAAKIKTDAIWCLDSDMVTHPDHLKHHMKWHHVDSEYIVLGSKRFVESWSYSPIELSDSLEEGNFDLLHSKSFPHDYVEARIKATNGLRNPKLEGFRSFVGATFSMLTSTWQELDGYHSGFTTGEDTELGWRATMHGFALVPESEAKAWHLGRTTFQESAEVMLAHNNPKLLNWIPRLRTTIRTPELGHIAWAVPDQGVIIDCRGISLAQFQRLIKPFIGNELESTFTLLGPWNALDSRYSPLEDPLKEQRSIKSWYQNDPRFIFIEAPESPSIEWILSLMPVDSTPFHYYFDGQIDPEINPKVLCKVIVKRELGLLGAIDSRGYRAFILYTPALGRAWRNSPHSLYRGILEGWGLKWATWSAIKDDRGTLYKRTLLFTKFALIRLRKVRSFAELSYLVKRGLRGSVK